MVEETIPTLVVGSHRMTIYRGRMREPHPEGQVILHDGHSTVKNNADHPRVLYSRGMKNPREYINDCPVLEDIREGYVELLTEGAHVDQNGNFRNTMLFHFGVWLATLDRLPRVAFLAAYKCSAPIVTVDALDKVVLFETKADRAAYRRWMANYRKNFLPGQPMQSCTLPYIPTTGSFRLHMVEYGVDGKPGFGLEEKWPEVVEEARGQVFATLRGFAFTNAVDAVKFKLSL